MVVSSETVIIKMMEEIQKAKKAVHHQTEMIEHISNVKLLSELLLEEHDNSKEIEQKESNREETLLKHKQIPSEFSSTNTINDEDGTSIFDF